MVFFITFTTIIHALAFAYDEYILNKRRDLSQAEINSALIDGLIYLSTVAFTIFTSYSEFLGNLYILFAVCSCISIVKNEYFYPSHLPKDERLTHALLYILHPLILYAFYLSWQQNFFQTNMTYWMLQLGYMALGFKAISYHVIYWNFIHRK